MAGMANMLTTIKAMTMVERKNRENKRKQTTTKVTMMEERRKMNNNRKARRMKAASRRARRMMVAKKREKIVRILETTARPRLKVGRRRRASRSLATAMARKRRWMIRRRKRVWMIRVPSMATIAVREIIP